MVGAWGGQGAHKTNQTGGWGAGGEAPLLPSLLPSPHLVGPLAAWTPGEAAARKPSTNPHPSPGNCSNFFLKGFKHRGPLSSHGPAPRPSLAKGSPASGDQRCPPMANPKFFKKKKKKETHQINKSKRECAQTQKERWRDQRNEVKKNINFEYT